MANEDQKSYGETEIVDADEGKQTVTDTDDGGAIITMEENAFDNKAKQKHFANIVEEVDQSKLQKAVTTLLELIDRDKEARSKRDKLYEEGLRRTGLGDDAPGGAAFSGASKVVHPVLVEACVDFSARVMKELWPPSGPVKSQIIGEREKSKVEKAERKAEFMNWQATKQMVEFKGELEQLSTQLPLGGGQYLKLMWNPVHKRPCSEFIAIDDVYLPFAATNFYSAERKTHAQYITEQEYQRRVKSGMYIDVNLGYASEPEFSKATQANDKIEGRQQSSYNEDGLRTVFEVYVSLEFEDDECWPYILTIDKSSDKALCLYRNWEADDPTYEELDWIVEFPFVPWRGAYPIGLTHLIGGLSGAATGALRALFDSAHIQNVPTLLKLKGGPGGQTLNVQPTEVVEMEGGVMIDDIRKIAMPVPFAGPSATLFQLLGFVVDAAKGVVQTSFEKLSDARAEQPVGTTLALIEQGMVVFSSIHSRLHSSMERCFKILHRINSAYLTAEDVAAQKSGIKVRPEDFDGPMDVVPVSDPAIFSETQRFAQVTAIQQRAALFPQLYDLRKVEELFLRNLKINADDILNVQPGTEDVDPVSENVAAAMGRPVYVLPRQDHVAHLKLHLAFLDSPMFGANPAIVKTFLYPMATHLRDHLLNFYLAEAHETVDKAQRDKLIEPDANEQAAVILQVQQEIEKMLTGFAEKLAQVDQAAQQFKPQPPMPPDSSMQVAQMNLQAQQAALQAKQQGDAAKLQADQQLEAQRLQAKQAADAAQLADNEKDRASEMAQEQLRQQQEDARTQLEVEARVGMNEADNATAMQLAAAEIESGEKFSISTGTGINPGTR